MAQEDRTDTEAPQLLGRRLARVGSDAGGVAVLCADAGAVGEFLAHESQVHRRWAHVELTLPRVALVGHVAKHVERGCALGVALPVAADDGGAVRARDGYHLLF